MCGKNDNDIILLSFYIFEVTNLVFSIKIQRAKEKIIFLNQIQFPLDSVFYINESNLIY